MKKLFFFAAAMVAAMSVNAAVYDLCVVDTTSKATAQSSIEAAFSFTNAYAEGNLDSNGKPYCDVKQKDSSTDWATTFMTLKADNNVKFIFKDGNANKLVLKCYVGYMQPNGGAVKLVVEGLKEGEKINIVTTQATPGVKVEGLKETEVDLEKGDNVFTLKEGTFAMYSKNDGGTTTKWRVAKILTGEDAETSEGVENVNASVKATKRFVNGQLVIVREGKMFNAVGAEL